MSIGGENQDSYDFVFVENVSAAITSRDGKILQCLLLRGLRSIWISLLWAKGPMLQRDIIFELKRQKGLFWNRAVWVVTLFLKFCTAGWLLRSLEKLCPWLWKEWLVFDNFFQRKRKEDEKIIILLDFELGSGHKARPISYIVALSHSLQKVHSLSGTLITLIPRTLEIKGMILAIQPHFKGEMRGEKGKRKLSN